MTNTVQYEPFTTQVKEMDLLKLWHVDIGYQPKQR